MMTNMSRTIAFLTVLLVVDSVDGQSRVDRYYPLTPEAQWQFEVVETAADVETKTLLTVKNLDSAVVFGKPHTPQLLVEEGRPDSILLIRADESGIYSSGSASPGGQPSKKEHPWYYLQNSGDWTLDSHTFLLSTNVPIKLSCSVAAEGIAVTTKAGELENCVEVTRQGTTTSDSSRVVAVTSDWYCADVGFVKSVYTERWRSEKSTLTMELIGYSIPE